MRELNSVDLLEGIVGTRPQTVMMKTIAALDDDSVVVLEHSPIAWIGYRDEGGRPHATVAGGKTGFAHAESPTSLKLELADNMRRPSPGAGVSLVFLLPGVGETLRVCGSVAAVSGTTLSIDVEEAWVHCAKCVLRSKLWKGIPACPIDRAERRPSTVDEASSDILTDPRVAEFLNASTFLAVSSWDGEGISDTSPKGDHPGFVQILSGRSLAIPDRKGNRRTDTFHNLLECDEVAMAALVPGRDEVLHVEGTAYATDDVSLLESMALGAKPPKAALVLEVRRGEIRENAALRLANIWDVSTSRDAPPVPDLMQLGARHIAANRTHGGKAAMTRALSKGLASAPGLLRRGVDRGYEKELDEEGY